ncbi:HDOD domain-containing protein [Thermodesulfobacteriota bacterium]
MDQPEKHALEKPNLTRVVDKIDDLSTLPQVLRKILDITADPNAGAADLQDILKSDPALTGKLLKVANSSYYGLREKVTNVKNAVVFLGFKTVKNMAVAASVCDMFKSDEKISGYSRVELWKHSVAVAVCAKSIAQRAGLKIGEELFTAGIMHDIGIIIADQYLHEHLCAVLESPERQETPFCELEKKLLGFDHAALGEKVAQQWKIPEDISRIIGFHHRPHMCPESHRIHSTIVYLSDVLCNAKQIGFIVNAQVDKERLGAALEDIKFQKQDISIILEELPRELDKAKELFIL